MRKFNICLQYIDRLLHTFMPFSFDICSKFNHLIFWYFSTVKPGFSKHVENLDKSS